MKIILKEIVKKEKLEGRLDIKIVEKTGIKIGKLLQELKILREGKVFHPYNRGKSDARVPNR